MATVQHGQLHSDLHDDESLLDDDLIDADDGEYLLPVPDCKDVSHFFYYTNLWLFSY